MECLNCQTSITDNFCPNCGQKTATKRFSIKSFFKEGILVGLFSFDKGFLFTLKALFTRPGHAIREYIGGKRASYINFSTLVLILLSINYLLTQFGFHSYSEILHTKPSDFNLEIDKIIKENQKSFMILMIPILSLFTYWFFRKSKLNFSEHIVLNTYKIAGELVLTLFVSISDIFISNSSTILIIGIASMVFSTIYDIWVYYQFFSYDGYSLLNTAIKTIIINLLIIFVIGIITAIFIVASGRLDGI